MNYSVGELAKAAGVSVRTLHHYDAIGLLKPTILQSNGYRSYGKTELLRLQQILFFKELDFSLDQIKEMMNNPKFDVNEAFSDQRKLLLFKKERIEKLIQTIDQRLKGGDNMNTNDLYVNFTDEELEQYKEEAKQKWGNTDAYKQSIERTKNWGKADYQKVFAESGAIYKALIELNKNGHGATSEEAQVEIGKFYNHLKHFYEPTPEMFRGLGEMYIADPRFKAFFDELDPNLAEYMKVGMAYFSDNLEK